MKNSRKDMDQNGSVFLYMKQKFPRISKDKINEAIFVGMRIREIMR
jgi:hypothetical protein